MSSVIATVKSIVGQVFAISAEGARRVLVEGDRLFSGDQVLTSANGAVTLELADGRMLDLGRESQWSEGDSRAAAQNAETAQQVESPGDDVAQLQQAIEAGLDPTQAFEATAAGPAAAGGSNAASGGHSFVVLDATAEVLQASIGFETSGLGNFGPALGTTQEPLQNQAPQFLDGNGGAQGPLNLQTNEDTPISGVFNVRDVNGDLITLTITRAPTNGTLVINANGTWTYTPAQDYNGNDSFQVTASDGRGASTPLNVNLGIIPVNDAPVASGTYESTVTDSEAADTFADIKGQLTASDVDDTQLTWSGSAKGAYGELTVNADGSYTYVIDAAKVNALAEGENASENFTVTVRDPSGASDTRVISINFTGSNDTPIAEASVAEVSEDDSIKGTLPGSDADAGATLSYGLDSPAPAGFNLKDDGSWTFDASHEAYQSLAEGQTLTLTIPYVVVDEFGAASGNTLTITVTGVNDAAILGSADVQLTETDEPLSTGGTLSISDVDSPATFVAQSDVAGTYGSFSIDANGNWTYVANSAFNELNVGQSYSESFKVASADGTESSVTVTINGSNDAAVLSSASVQLTETNAPLTANGTLSISDVDSPATFVAQNNVSGQYGSFSIDATGNWSFVASSAYNELNVGQSYSETFNVESADGTQTSVTVTINGSNDRPVGVADRIAMDEDTTATGNVLSNDTDVDNTSLSVTKFSLTNLPFVSVKAGETLDLGVGKLTIQANGDFTFVPASNYNGAVPSVTYTLSDGSLTSTATLRFDITPVNDAPVNTTPGAQTLAEDGSKTFSLLNGNSIAVSDVDGDRLTTTLSVEHGVLTLGPLKGGVTFSGNGTGSITLVGTQAAINLALQGLKYVPGKDYNGQDTLTINSSDGKLSDSDSVSLTITPVNDAPVATPTSAATSEDAPEIGGQLAASDVDGDSLTFTAQGALPAGFTLNENGTWTLDPSNAAYQHLAEGQSTTLTINFTASDGKLTSNSTLTLTVTGVNDQPTITAAQAEAVEGAGEIKGQIAANDVDDGAVLSFSTTANIAGLSLGSDGSWTFDANHSAYDYLKAGEQLVLEVPVSVTDEHGASADSTLTITLTGTNDAPVANAVSASGNEDQAARIQVNLSGSDVDGSVSSFTIGTLPANGTLYASANGGTALNSGDSVNGPVYFVPNKDWNGTTTFEYSAVDNDGATSAAPATATITIAAVNDRPVGVNDNVTLDEDTTATGNVLSNDRDVDGDTLSVTRFSLTNFPLVSVRAGETLDLGVGKLTIKANGDFTFEPAKNYNGAVPSVTYTLSDGSLNSTATLKFDVTPVNDAPVNTTPGAQTLAEDGSKTFSLLNGNSISVSDIDGDRLTTTVSVEHGVLTLGPLKGGVTFSGNGTGSITLSGTQAAITAALQGLKYVPSENYNGQDSLTISTSDGTLSDTDSIRLTITPVNDAPVAAATTAETVEDAPAIGGQLAANDVDGDTLSFSLNNPAPAGFSLNANGSWTFDPSNAAYQSLGQGEELVIQVPFTVTDGKLSSASTLTLTITGVNDAPVVTGAISVSTDEDAAGQVINLLANASDADAKDSLSVVNLSERSGNDASGVSLQGNTLVVDPSKYNYLAAGERVVLTYDYQVSDGKGGLVTTSATVTIDGVNDAPVVSTAITQTTNEDASALQVDLLANASDVDTSDVLSVTNVQLVGSGDTSGVTVSGNSLQVNPNAYNYLAAGQELKLTYSYDVIDGNGGVTPTTVTLTIEGRNDAPVMESSVQSGSVTERGDGVPGENAGSLTASGDIGFSDADLSNTHTVGTQLISAKDGNGQNVDALGNLSAAISDAAQGDGEGSVHWNYSVAAGALDYLGAGETLTLVYRVTVTDSSNASTSRDVTITLTGSNDAPIVSGAITSLTNEDASAYSIDLLQKASDEDANDQLSVSNLKLVGSGDTSGVTFDAASNSLKVDPSQYDYLAVGEKVVLNYSYDISDGHGGLVSTTASLTIEGRNDAPVVTDTRITSAEESTGTPLNIAAPTDVDSSDSLTINVTGLPLVGRVTLADGSPVSNGQSLTLAQLQGLKYDAPADYKAGDTVGNFTYSVNDGTTSVVGSVAINVTPVNDLPVVDSTSLTVAEESVGTPLGLKAPSDVDGDTLTIKVTGLPQVGQITLADGSPVSDGQTLSSEQLQGLKYNAPADYNAGDAVGSFTYSVNDGTTSVTGSVTLGVTPVNDLPVVDSTSLTVAEESVGTPLGLQAPTDVDGDALTITVTGLPVVGQITLADGSLVSNGQTLTSDQLQGLKYNAPADYQAGDAVGNFTYSVNDGTATLSGSVALGVTPVNDAPDARDDVPVLTGLKGNYYAYREGADGPNLSNLAMVKDFIGKHAADATFTATSLDYGNGVSSDLGGDGNLQKFLGSDATSLNTDPANSSDAILELSGAVNLNAGNYQLRVTADDGFSIVIDGKVVAEYNGNQGPTTREFATFNVPTSGAHQIQIVYWDQAGQAQLKVEMRPEGGSYTVLGGTSLSHSLDALITNEDTALTIEPATLLGNDTDADGDSLTIVSVQNAVNGTVELVGGKVVFTPAANFNGTGSFTYTVSDGNGGTDTATVKVGVTAVNDLPLVDSHALTVNEKSTGTALGIQAPTDVDNDALTITVTGLPVVGQVTLADGTPISNNQTLTSEQLQGLKYNAPADYKAGDAVGSFTYSVNDGTASVNGAINLAVNPVNDAPVLNNVFINVDEDGTLVSQLNATDADGDTLTYTLKSGVSNGTLVLDSATGQYTYKPNANYNGPDSFIVTVKDGNGGVVDAVVRITVDPVNDAPTANPASLTTNEDTPINGKVDAQDIDNDTLSYRIASGNGPQNGTLTLYTDGSYTYRPNKDYNGSDSFTITISDGKGGVTTSLISIDVLPINDAPITADQTKETDEDHSVSGQIVARDVEGDTLTYTIASGVDHGSLLLNTTNGEYTYTPNKDYNGSDSFTIRVYDGKGAYTDAVVNVTINPVNDAPVSGPSSISTNEDTPIDGRVTARDVDSDPLTYSIANGDGPQHGSVTLKADGTYTYEPAKDFNGSDSFTVTIDDGKGGTTTSVVNITVKPINDAPVTADQSKETDEDQSVSGKIVASDVDGDTLTYVIQAGVDHGSLLLNTTNGEYTYTPNKDFNGTDTFTIRVYDPKLGYADSVVNIKVNPINDAPVSGPSNISTNEDTPVDGRVNARDVDGDTLSYSIANGNGPQHGSVVMGPNGTYTYQPAKDFNGSDSFTVTIDDGKGGTTTSVVNVTVNALNDAPEAPNSQASVDEDGTLTSRIVATDAEGDSLTYAIKTGTAHGSLVLDQSTGQYTYKPNGDYNGSDSFVVTIRDGKGGVTDTQVNITVNPVNDAPTSADNTVTTDEDTPRGFSSADFAFNDIDAGDSLKAIRINSLPASGSLSLGNEAVTIGMIITAAQIASLVYTPTANANGSSSFSFSVQDQSGAFSTTPNTMTLQVTAVDDAPGLVDSSVSFAENLASGSTIANLSDRFTGTDQDRDGEPLLYSITGGNDAGLFAINSSTGVITLANGKSLDYETATQHQLQVSATDGKTPVSATVTVNVTNINDNGVVISDSDAAANRVVENASTGTVVGVTAKGVDGDVGATVTQYELLDNAGGRFAIDASTGVVTVADGSKLDYESATSHDITVKATSSDGSSNTQVFTINLSNVNDNGVVITDSDAAANRVNENAANGTLVGITAKGVDGDVGATVTQYELLDNAGGRFAINATTGVVTVADGSKLDYETATSHNITVKATSSDGSSNTQVFTVQLGNLNEFGVTLSDVDATTNSVAENAANGTAVGITARGVDGDAGTTVSYALTNDAGGRFAINATTGVVTVADGSKLDFETATSHSITVLATSSDGSTRAETYSIAVTNVNEAPVVVSGASVTGAEDSNYTFAWSDFKVSDVDANSSLSIKIESLPGEGKLQIKSGNSWVDVSANATVSKSVIDAGGLRFVPDSNESGHDSFGGNGVGLNQATYATFKYSGSDGSLSTASSTMNIDIAPVADVPTLTVKSAATSTLFTTTWESAPDSNYTSELISGSTFENWTLVTTGDKLTGGSNVFEVWGHNDRMENQAGTEITIKMQGSGNNDALELNDSAGTMAQTLGITRNVATEVGKVYELSMDYAGRLGFDTSYTKIAVYLGNTLVGEYGSTSSQTSLNWENIHFSFVGTGSTEALTIKLAGTSTNDAGRGALIDNISLSSSQGVVAGDGGVSGKTSIALSNYISGVLTDTDGSESLRYDLSNLPSGASVVVGGTTLSAVNGVISLTAAQLATAKLQIDSSVRGEIGLDIKAVSVEPNGSSASSSSQHLTLNIIDGGVEHSSYTTNTITASETAGVTALGSGLTGEYWGYQEDSNNPNLTSLSQVENYIESRSGNNSSLVGSNTNAANGSLNASFIANQIDYGLKNGSPVFSDDLGDNRDVRSGRTIGSSNDSQNNLYDFLTAASVSNVSNLRAGGAWLGDTTDAIIRAHGFVSVAAGTYDIRITADDGYRLLIGGQDVANVDKVQSTTTDTFKGVNLTGGLQALELLYWDQGGHASLKVELKLSGSSDSTYQTLGAGDYKLFQATTLSSGQELVQTDTGWAVHTIQTTTGSEANDLINGSKYSDILNGGNGHDVLYGNAGHDLLNGGDGNDLLIGGVGNDTLTGGAGADTFVWKAGDLGNDVITDFKASDGDRIDLSDLLPDAANANNLLDYLKVDTTTNTLQVSTTGNVANGADVTIKLEGVDLTQYGSTSAQIVNSLVAGADPLVKTEHS
ncbi:retention module-containing protein [Pseudomonas sp. C11]|uniref:retention module-containing protein n=1 Tax=Pseudomonas sp. C11 TaxID=3075550 RepID=UPI002AFF525E|nr:retention module-containing protein [Pseudomonas sp. C11]